MLKLKIPLIIIFILLLTLQGHSAAPLLSSGVTLRSDSMEQVRSFRERINSIQEKITSARLEKEIELSLMSKKEEPYKKTLLEVATAHLLAHSFCLEMARARPRV